MSRRQTHTHTKRHARQCGVTSNIFNYETLKVAKLKCNEHEPWVEVEVEEKEAKEEAAARWGALGSL